MATLHLTLILGTVFVWIIIVMLIYKLFCDRLRELRMLDQIQSELKSVKEEIKLLQK